MFIGQRGNQTFSPFLCQARFSHQHPTWHIVDCQQIYVIVLKSLDTLLKPGDVVSDAFSSFPLELVRDKEHLETLTLLLWSLLVQALPQAWSSRLQCLDGFCQPYAPSCQ